MLNSIASMCKLPSRRGSKIHPENIITPPDASEKPRPLTPTPRKDPCENIYTRYREPGAYEQYQKLLTSKTI